LAPSALKVGALFHAMPRSLRASCRLMWALGIDLLSLSAHKFYGPKGIGALFIAGDARPRIAPIIHGGGQQDGMRAGTLAPMLCAGLAAAAEKALAEQAKDEVRTRALKSRLA
jgi:cysteine desulfurase